MCAADDAAVCRCLLPLLRHMCAPDIDQDRTLLHHPQPDCHTAPPSVYSDKNKNIYLCPKTRLFTHRAPAATVFQVTDLLHNSSPLCSLRSANTPRVCHKITPTQINRRIHTLRASEPAHTLFCCSGAPLRAVPSPPPLPGIICRRQGGGRGEEEEEEEVGGGGVY